MDSSLNLYTQTFNPTMRKFGVAEPCIRQYEYGNNMLRPAQLSFASVFLATFEPADKFSELAPDYFNELELVTNDLEKCLKSPYSCDKLNYSIGMMVNAGVHFHFTRTYSEKNFFGNSEYIDASCPGPSDIGQFKQTDDKFNRQITQQVSENCLHWE